MKVNKPTRIIYGILSSEVITGYISFADLHSALQALNMLEYYTPLLQTIKGQLITDEQQIPLAAIIATLKNSSFMNTLPIRIAGSPTYVNLQTVEATLLIVKRKLLTLDEIRTIANAFVTEVKSRNALGIPLDAKEINSVLRQADKVISEKLIKAWLDRYSKYLFWRKDFQHAVTINNFNKRMLVPQIYLHEFLFLACNFINRLPYIKSMKLYRKESAAKDWLLPVEKLTLHPECKNLNEEMTRNLNQEYEDAKYQLVFEGVSCSTGDGNKNLHTFDSKITTIFNKNKRRIMQEEKRLFGNPEAYKIIRHGLKHSRTRSDISNMRQVIANLKKTSIYQDIKKRKRGNLNKSVNYH